MATIENQEAKNLTRALEMDRTMPEEKSQDAGGESFSFKLGPRHQMQVVLDCKRSREHSNSTTFNCANMSQCRVSSRYPRTTHASLLQRLYIMTRRIHRGADQSDSRAPSHLIVNRTIKRSKASYTSEHPLRPAFICLVLMVTLTPSFYLISHAAESGSPDGIADGAKPIAIHGQESKPSAGDRIDSLSSKSESSSSSSSSSSSEKSIVASLSSAVATAAAAAAVAAAQNSLSSSDARSLVSGSHHRDHHHAQRSPGLNLAIKLVDTIPEVPYNILHNMKKLDHAAPFYNVPNKMSGSTKESSQNFLSSALAASGNLGGAAEQLSALFRSPIWKRIADGYGEFTSEFRSRFRAPGAAPMKGPTSSTSKLLRDISVPALLMLLASSVSGADWRPVRTRRKSFAPVDIPAALPSGLVSSPAFLSPEQPFKPSQFYQPDMVAQQQQSQLQMQPEQPKPNMVEPLISEATSSNSWVDQSAPGGRLQYSGPLAPPSASEPNQMTRASDLALQLRPIGLDEGGLAKAWPIGPASSHLATAPQATFEGVINGVQDQNQQFYGYQPMTGAGLAQQQAVKRSDEIIATDAPSSKAASPSQASKPPAAVGAGQQRTNLFSSLTSDLALGQAKLMSKLFNANVGSDGNSYRIMSLADGLNKVSPFKRDQLSDKQRYSLLEPTTDSMSALPDGSPNEQPLSASSTKPFLLSAMAHAANSMINAQVPSESGSSAPTGQTGGRPGFFSRANFQHLIGEKTINHEDTLMRRQPQQAAEQRDLTKLLPESWREVVKRTVSTVQQQANVQWKSIEGQLTNWVQDKLKTVASSASGASPSSSASSSSSSVSSGGSHAAHAPVANVLASMSSTALNILGLHKNANSSTHSHSASDHPVAATDKVDKSSSGSEAPGANQKGKLEKKPSGTGQQPSRGALAGVASAIVKSFTNRQSSSSTTSTTAPSSPLSSPPKYTLADPTQTETNNDAQSSKPQSLASADDTHDLSLSANLASKYPTLTGSRADSGRAPTEANSIAGGAPTRVDVHNAND